MKNERLNLLVTHQKNIAFVDFLPMKSKIHEGEVLRLLIWRRKLQVKDVAAALNVKDTSLSRAFKSESLSPKMKNAAAKYFGVGTAVFNEGIGYSDTEQPNVLKEPLMLMEEIKRLEARDIQRSEEIKQLTEALLRERTISDDLRKMLMKMLDEK